MSQGHTYYKALALEKWLHLTNAKFEIWEVLMNIIGRVLITAVTTNTCPQRLFSLAQTCGLVDVNQQLP